MNGKILARYEDGMTPEEIAGKNGSIVEAGREDLGRKQCIGNGTTLRILL